MYGVLVCLVKSFLRVEIEGFPEVCDEDELKFESKWCLRGYLYVDRCRGVIMPYLMWGGQSPIGLSILHRAKPNRVDPFRCSLLFGKEEPGIVHPEASGSELFFQPGARYCDTDLLSPMLALPCRIVPVIAVVVGKGIVRFVFNGMLM